MEIKTMELIKDGKRNVKLCNGIRTQMFGKIKEVLENEGFEVTVAANGELAITTAIDASTEATYYTRLAVSFTDKPLDTKIVKKAKEKAPEVEIPNIFAE